MDGKQKITNQQETTNHEIELECRIPKPYRQIP